MPCDRKIEASIFFNFLCVGVCDLLLELATSVLNCSIWNFQVLEKGSVFFVLSLTMLNVH